MSRSRCQAHVSLHGSVALLGKTVGRCLPDHYGVLPAGKLNLLHDAEGTVVRRFYAGHVTAPTIDLHESFE
ncbi:hypothetical protein PSAC2689_10182 [Paraburkholderia sacchari]